MFPHSGEKVQYRVMDEPEEQERGTGRNKMLRQALLPKMFYKKKTSSLTTITYYLADSWKVNGLILNISTSNRKRHI